MKRILFAVFSLIIVSAQAQTADEIIQKYANNLGGLENINKITSAKMTGIYSSQGNELPITTQIINGKAMRTDLEFMGQTITNCYYNGKGWKVNPLAGVITPTDVADAELADFKAQSNLASNLMDYKSRGHRVELTGEEAVEGIKTYKIKLTNKDDGKVTNYFISTMDYTLIKSSTTRQLQGQDMEVETFYSNLKDIGGVKFFMTRDSKIEGQVFQSVTFEKIELNVTIDEKVFEKN